jgi:acyl transferase domain-containing protein
MDWELTMGDFVGLHIGGAGEAIIANRISHFFDLRGTSMTIDTGCVSDLYVPFRYAVGRD